MHCVASASFTITWVKNICVCVKGHIHMFRSHTVCSFLTWDTLWGSFGLGCPFKHFSQLLKISWTLHIKNFCQLKLWVGLLYPLGVKLFFGMCLLLWLWLLFICHQKKVYSLISFCISWHTVPNQSNEMHNPACWWAVLFSLACVAHAKKMFLMTCLPVHSWRLSLGSESYIWLWS